MTKGYVETSVTKCLILGAAGVGKTHLKHLLLKKDPPQRRVSTGLADNPARAISFSLAGVGGQEGDDWFVLEDDQALLKVVGGTIRDGISMETPLKEVVTTLPKMAINEAGAVHSYPTPAGVNVTMTAEQSRPVDIEEAIIHHINHPTGKRGLSTDLHVARMYNLTISLQTRRNSSERSGSSSLTVVVNFNTMIFFHYSFRTQV